MFEFVRTHTRLFFFVLLILIIPSFVFFGIDNYRQMNEGGNVVVAKVDGQPVRQIELDNALRTQGERLRQQMPDLDIKVLDSVAFKQEVLDALVNERVQQAAINKLHLSVSDERLQKMFATDPQFANIRNADGSVNRDILATMGMSSEMLAQSLRFDFSRRQVTQPLGMSSFATNAIAASAFDAYFQQREVQIERFDATALAGKIKPTEAEIEAFYQEPSTQAAFRSPEQVKVEWVMLDLATMAKGVTLNAEDVKKYYEQNIARYTTREERRASHILIAADAAGSKDERAKAKAKAEALLAEVKADPKRFADLAKKNSNDPGSAERGGDLDFFARGAMVKPFEDAVFALKTGEISPVVESDFGYHVIMLTDVRGGQSKPFEAVRAEIEAEVRKQEAQKRYAAAAEEFSNMVYEQADSLQPVVEKFKLTLNTQDHLTRNAAPGATGPLANAKVLAAIFKPDSLSNKRNTDAIDIGSSQLVSARVVTHTPAAVQPLAQVREAVVKALVLKQAAALAKKEGEARLQALKSDASATMKAPPVVVSRLQMQEQPPVVVDGVLKAKADKLPVVEGIDLGAAGYAVVKINRIVGRDPLMANNQRGIAQVGQAYAQAEVQAYEAALKKRFKAEVMPNAIAATAATEAGEGASAASR